MTIHWCGTGLSAIPGLRRLLENGHAVTVWNRTTAKAQDAVGDLTQDVRVFSIADLTDALQAGDIVVSMLPGDLHVPLAQLAISKQAHFVSSSYISPEMRALDAQAKSAGLCLVNEIGLDPGIDHLMAHALVDAYKTSPACDADNDLSFISYCGGIPKTPNPFRYKFSWSPLGVLKALRSPSRSLRNFETLDVARPWDAISTYTAPLPSPESFEVYPNRDSLPFVTQYEFAPDWKVRDFVRGTLRLNGWAEAWKDVFAEVETLDGAAGDARLKAMSDQFWTENAYDTDEADRVVLCVALKAEKENVEQWHKSYVLDAWGDARGTAMARLVSVPVSLAIEAVLAQKLKPGVQAATADLELITAWMGEISQLAQHVAVIDHLS
ncbi:saccharopine dehydrogenase NADP-binding domain-containing protein [Epibacterium ulvae]|uniref:saccharopine dehydrogenase family protein n=1 Tax=Epibacterium ulvae TaxID=1156985 RepID=UPI001BFCA41F|nr:saccharopine dehydrogenase family protein [Epibacterium ulvae]MBT8155079.1 saccharopine dehydrogenase NADP-binding domain-containing protein [Epibacterium ulvae]